MDTPTGAGVNHNSAETNSEPRTAAEKQKTAEQTRNWRVRIQEATRNRSARTRLPARARTPAAQQPHPQVPTIHTGIRSSGGHMRTYGRDVRHLRTLSAVIEDSIAIFAQDASE